MFLLKILCELNESENPLYKIDCVLRKDKFLRLTITSKLTKRKINLADSYLLLNDSLDNLGKNFELDTLKSIFPYEFSKENTLFYISNTPDISY